MALVRPLALTVCLLVVPALAGCLGGDPETPDVAPPEGAVLLLDPPYTWSGGTAVLRGEVLLQGALDGPLEVAAFAPPPWEVEAVRVAPGDDPLRVPFLLNVSAPGDATVGDNETVVVTAVDGGVAVAEGWVRVEVADALWLPPFVSWDKKHLEILIVPPAHGPIANLHEGVLPEGPEGALPGGAYLAATLHVMSDWRHALDSFSRNRTDMAWVGDITWEIRVVAEDVVLPEDVLQADIVKFYTESTGAVLGAAANTGGLIGDPAPGCVAFSTKWTTYGSLSYKDMYKLAGHELGHCLGPSHTENDAEDWDIMKQGGYPQDELRCPSNLNALAVASAFSGAFGEDVPGTVAVAKPAFERYCDPESDPRDAWVRPGPR